MLTRLALAFVLTSTSFAALASAQASWHRRYPASVPAWRSNAMLAFDDARAQGVLLFGQGPGNAVINDAWNWDGMNWTQVTAALPPVRVASAMVYDAARQRLVLFAGSIQNGSRLQDLWEWDGAQWASRTPAASPAARQAHGLAYDRSRALVVMFGGEGNAGRLSDTWTWNGTQWLQRTPAHQPPPRYGHVMAFDPVGDGVLLYGGSAAGGAWTDETWLWNGTDWTMRMPATPPFIRISVGMATDIHRRRVVLYGGTISDNSTWEWDGTEWDSRLLPGPGPRMGAAMAYDAVRRQTVLFGGDQLNDTWAYYTPSPATYTAYGAGCPGSIAVPTLTNAPYSLPWVGDTFTARAGNLAPSVGAVIFATGLASTPPQDLTSFGMPGCFGLLSPLAAELRLANAGAADWMLVIPNEASLAGTQLFQQAFALEPGSNAAEVIVSNGAQLTAGIR